MRGPWQERGWLFYEFNRAMCRIALDKAFEGGRPTDEETREGIRSDLAAAWHSDLKELVRGDAVIARWMRVNGVSEGDLAEV
jgi:hypothetical protein